MQESRKDSPDCEDVPMTQQQSLFSLHGRDMTIVKVTSKPDASGTWRYIPCDCGHSATLIFVLADGTRVCFSCFDAQKKEQVK